MFDKLREIQRFGLAVDTPSPAAGLKMSKQQNTVACVIGPQILTAELIG